MKNLKKLVSSVLAVALLAGSAVSLSCSAEKKGRKVKQQPDKAGVSQEATMIEEKNAEANPENATGSQEGAIVQDDEKSAEGKEDKPTSFKIDLVASARKKEPLPGECILKLNPFLKREIDELYNPQGDDDLARIYSCDKALTALDKLKKDMLKSRDYTDKQKKEISHGIELIKQAVRLRKAKLKGSLTDSMKDSLRKIERKLKNAISSLMPYVLKIGAASLIVGVCYLIGYQGFEFITKCLWALIGGGLKIIGGAVWNILSGFGSGTYNLGSFAYNCFNSTNPNCTAYNLFFGNLTELFPGNLN